MRVLVTGATGLVGRRLTRRLLDAGHEVVALTRNVRAAEVVLPVRCEIYEWDPSQGKVDSDSLAGADAVLHLAGEGIADRRWDNIRKREIYASRVDATHILVGALEDLPEAERPRIFVCASAIGYYGDRYDEVLDEDSDPGTGFLADLCWHWEDQIAYAEELGMRAVGLRTGIVLAKGGGALAKMLPPFRLGVGGRLGSGKQWMSWIHIDDLVSLYLFALENESVAGPVNAVAPKPVTNSQFSKALARALRRPCLFPVPAAVLRLVLGEMSELLLSSQRVHPAAASEFGFQFDYPDLAAALADLTADFSIEIDSEIWLERTPEEVFPFFSDAMNLEMLTPPTMSFRVRKMSTETIGDGTLIDYRLKLRGVPMKWRSRIDVWDPPRSFVDSELKGPYRSWHHTHEFEAFDDGTIVRDRVRYELPFGALGQLVAGQWVARDLSNIFDYRRAVLFSAFPPDS